MKLKFEMVINACQETVWAAFDNPENLPRWQQHLASSKLVSGECGQPGAVSELVYDENGRTLVLTEVKLERRAPNFLAATYETPMSKTLNVNHFDVLDDNKTRWSLWCNFRLKGWQRFKAIFVAGKVRERTEADMARFKLMVETDVANAEA